MQSCALVTNGLVFVALLAGCAHDVRTASSRRTFEPLSRQQPHGYVEFYASTNNAVIPIYRADKEGTPQLLSAVGLKAGEKYDFRRDPVMLAERLRVAAPPGQARFMIDGQGPLVAVPVSEGKTTPVVIDYTLIDRGEIFAVYRADARVLEPMGTNVVR